MYLPLASKNNPGGQTQEKDPSVLIQVPPPLHKLLLSWHSLISEHTLPSTYNIAINYTIE